MKKRIAIFSVLMLVLTAGINIYGAETPKALNTIENKIERKIDPNKPMVALTFDDGPSAKYTEIILDALKKHNSAATFFVVGSAAEKNKDILVRMVKEGHEIGNHTHDHARLTELTDKELNFQLLETQRIITNATGYTPVIMRPPYGALNDELTKKIPMPAIIWSIDTLDWKHRNTEVICNNILKDIKNGDIVLMHDLYETTAKAAEIVIPELVNRGYQLVTVSELYEYKKVELLAGRVYRNMYR